MRRLIVANIVSVDGFYSGPNDDVMAMPFDTTFSDYNLERLRAADTLLLGRRSFEGFRDYWRRSPTTRSSHRSSARSLGSTTRSRRSSSPTP